MSVSTDGVRSPARMRESMEVDIPQASAMRCCSPRKSPDLENSIDRGVGSRPLPAQWMQSFCGRGAIGGRGLLPSSRRAVAATEELMRGKYSRTRGQSGQIIILTAGQDSGYDLP